MDQFLINLLNGISSGLLLFMLSSGLTLIFSMMGVLNFAHASFYMVGALGALFERTALRRVHKFGHVPSCWSRSGCRT